jgi:rhodanese-related sulfurtransferase
VPIPNVINLSVDQAHKIIKEEKELIIIDVRGSDEYSLGHLKGAKLYPLNLLPKKILALEKYRKYPILIYCSSGGRSPSAVKLFMNHGFPRIYHMYQGISAWPYTLER